MKKTDELEHVWNFSDPNCPIISEWPSFENKGSSCKFDIMGKACLDTKDDIDVLLKKGLRGYFRGMKQAKYKNYSSAYRFWVNEGLYPYFNPSEALPERFLIFCEVILKIVEKSKISEKLKLFYQSQALRPILNKDFFYFSLLQHFGAPSPLIDVTRSLKIALFFAIENIPETDLKLGQGNKIDDYVAVYYFPTDIFLLADTSQSFSDLAKNGDAKVFLLDDSHQKKNIIYSNENIIAQQGAFLFLDPWVEFLEKATGNISIKVSCGTKSRNIYLPKIECFNIHKGLASYIRKRLLADGISKDTIYPTKKAIAEEIRKAVCQEALLP